MRPRRPTPTPLPAHRKVLRHATATLHDFTGRVYIAGPLDAVADAVDAFTAAGVDATGPACAMAAGPLTPDALAESTRGDVDNILSADVVAVLPGTPDTNPDVTMARSIGVPVVLLGR